MELLALPLLAVLLLTSGCRGEKSQDIGAEQSPPKTTHAQGSSTPPAASAAPTSAANKNVEIRPLSGRAFAVQDFGPVPRGPVNDVIRQLRPLALAGDGASSYALFLKLNECSDINRRLAKGRPIQDADAASQCEELSAEDEVSRSEWLSLAAEQGNIGAQLLYSMDSASALGGEAAMLRDPEAVMEYKRKATSYLEGLASQGSADALLQLGNAYQAGVLVNEDLVASRAYFEAVRLSDPSLVPTQQVKGLENEMSAEQISTAVRKGEQIYGSCCR